MGAARLRAQQQRSARASAGFQPAFCETPAAHSLSFSLSASDDFSYVSVLPARLYGSIILALRPWTDCARIGWDVIRRNPSEGVKLFESFFFCHQKSLCPYGHILSRLIEQDVFLSFVCMCWECQASQALARSM